MMSFVTAFSSDILHSKRRRIMLPYFHDDVLHILFC